MNVAAAQPRYVQDALNPLKQGLQRFAGRAAPPKCRWSGEARQIPHDQAQSLPEEWTT